MTLIQTVGILLLAALLIVIGRASYSAFKYIRAFPTNARRKNIKAKYTDLINDLNKAIEQTTSINELNKALERINYPPETILVVIQRENADETDREYAHSLAIINRLETKNKRGEYHSRVEVLNGSGYGQINDQHFYIWRHNLKKYGYDYIEIRLERDMQDLVVAQQ